MSRIINYILILTGAIIAIYAKAGERQNQYILILGIVVLMLGIYRISRGISSKKEQNEDEQNNAES